jgi:hypothetical protein
MSIVNPPICMAINASDTGDYLGPNLFHIIFSITQVSYNQGLNYYNGLNVRSGQWLSNYKLGFSWRIKSIISQNSASVNCIVEDVEDYNISLDPDGTNTGSFPGGLGYLYELSEDGIPALFPIDSTLTADPFWITNQIGRFRSRNYYNSYVRVYQPSHPFQLGSVIYLTSTGSYSLSSSSSSTVYDSIGIVSSINVTNSNYFTYKPFGTFLPSDKIYNSLTQGIGSVYYLNSTGGLTTIKPSSNSYPVYIQVSTGGDGILLKGQYDLIASTGSGGGVGLQGDIGSQGLMGPTGTIGLQGSQGFQGLIGATGASGLQGTQGLQGSIGLQGLEGLQGIQGIIGTQGSQGLQGISGLQGLMGSTGASGLQGTQGYQGLQGDIGFQGLQGLIGSTGASGLQGTQGLQGLQGDIGYQGLQGNMGIQGYQGATGTQGYQGLQGDIGPQGLSGLQGLQGLIGSTGERGYQGYQGTDGLQGFQGNQGSAGSIGERGYQGLEGSMGVQGYQGYQGFAGSTGTIGYQGFQGLIGLIGSTGSSGLQGNQGLIGSQGTQGLIGLQGLVGLQGLEGSAGSIGLQGATGDFGATNFTWDLLGFNLLNSNSIKSTTTFASAFSYESYIIPSCVIFQAGQTNRFLAGGFTDTFESPLGLSGLIYGFYLLNNTQIRIYESGVDQGIFGTYTTSTFFMVIYDGSYVKYYVDGVLVRTVSRSITSALYLYFYAFSTNTSIYNAHFFPMSPIGAQGLMGATGSAGSQGFQGLMGATGSKGNDGVQGLQGLAGSTGSIGLQGTQGLQGIQGNVGLQGSQGFVGTQGNQGEMLVFKGLKDYKEVLDFKDLKDYKDIKEL